MGGGGPAQCHWITGLDLRSGTSRTEAVNTHLPCPTYGLCSVLPPSLAGRPSVPAELRVVHKWQDDHCSHLVDIFQLTKYFYLHSHLPLTPTLRTRYQLLIFQMRKLRIRQADRLGQGHRASGGKSRDQTQVFSLHIPYSFLCTTAALEGPLRGRGTSEAQGHERREAS